MSGTLVIARRELASLFYSPLGWSLLCLAVLLHGTALSGAFAQLDGEVGQALMYTLSGGTFWMTLMILPPLLAMRLFADEARSGTLEYLLTAPVSDAAVVVGKFLAGTSFLAILWATTLVYAACFGLGGVPVDWLPLFGAFFGALCLSGLFIAIGLTISSLVDAPLIAAFMSFAASFAWLMLPTKARDWVGHLAGWFEDEGARNAVLEGGQAMIDAIDLTARFGQSFSRGEIDTSELVFFLSWPAFFLFLAVRTLEFRRWRG